VAIPILRTIAVSLEIATPVCGLVRNDNQEGANRSFEVTVWQINVIIMRY